MVRPIEKDLKAEEKFKSALAEAKEENNLKQSDFESNNILTNEIALKGFVKFDISIQSKDENSKVSLSN